MNTQEALSALSLLRKKKSLTTEDAKEIAKYAEIIRNAPPEPAQEAEENEPSSDTTEEITSEAPADDTGNTDEPPAPKEDKAQDWKKRYGDLRSHASTREKELLAEIESLKKARPVYASKEDVDKFNEEYDSISPVIQEMIAEGANSLFQQKWEAFAKENELKEEKTKLSKEQFEVATQIIADAHPDWDNIRISGIFKTWLSKQNDRIKALSNEDDPYSAITVLDLFKKDTGYSKKAKSEQKKALTEVIKVKSNSSTPQSPRPVDIKKVRDELNSAARRGDMRKVAEITATLTALHNQKQSKR